MNNFYKIKNKKRSSGFTLIEVVVYLALFSIIIGGAMVSVLQIVESSTSLQSKVVMEEEANFLLRKINWALNGATTMSVSGDHLTLTIINPYLITTGAHTFVFDIDSSGGYLRLSKNGATAINLNSQNVKVSNLAFTYSPPSGAKPASVNTHFNLMEKESGDQDDFETTRYLRK